MTKTNQQLVDFLNFAHAYLAKHKEQTKFRYALERMGKRLEKHAESYNESLADLDVEHAATEGEKGPILTDEHGRFRYTKDGIRARTKARKELLERSAEEFEPYFATEVPEHLNDAEKAVCAGFVIEEQAELAEPAEPKDGKDE